MYAQSRSSREAMILSQRRWEEEGAAVTVATILAVDCKHSIKLFRMERLMLVTSRANSFCELVGMARSVVTTLGVAGAIDGLVNG